MRLRWRALRRQEVGGEFVVAGVDAAKVLEPTVGVLDEASVAVTRFVVTDGALSVAAARDDGCCAGLASQAA